MSLYIGVDIGGTNIKVAAVAATGKVVARGIVETGSARAPARAFQEIHAAARQLCAGRSLAGVGIACAGLVRSDTGRLLSSPNLPAWKGATLRGLARRHFGVPIVIENDATAAAFGESIARGRAGRDLVMLTLGTGVGGGIVSGGRVVGGADGFAGEIGHVVIDTHGPPCHCGKRGCLEAFTGAYTIVRTARSLSARRGGREWRDAREVMEAARRGEAAARTTVRAVGEAIGVATAIVLNTLNPSVVVIGGGVGGSFSMLAPHIRRSAARHAFPEMVRAARIEKSRLGNDAAVVGAAMLARAGRSPVKPPRRR